MSKIALIIDADEAHVLLDAIAIAVRQAWATNFQPWNDYDADEYDYKTTSSGWFAILDDAKDKLMEGISR